MTNWRLEAACRGMDVNLFFANDDRREQPPQVVKGTCASCTVAKDCLADAVKDASTIGIRAGLTTSQRRKERYALGIRIQQPAAHGTYAGYRAHQRMGTEVCQPCHIAGGKYLRERRLQRSGFGKA